MSIELIKKNIAQEKILVERLKFLVSRSNALPMNSRDKKTFEQSIQSTKNQILILNYSFPELIKGISFAKPLPSESGKKPEKDGKVISVSHEEGGIERNVGILKSDRKRYLKELHISNESLKNLRSRKKGRKKEFVHEYKKPRGYIKLANRFFGESASKMVEKGNFRNLSIALRKGNFTMLTKSYVSMMFFTTFLSGFVGILLAAIFLFVGITFDLPYIYLIDFGEKSIVIRLLEIVWFIPLTPIATFVALYFYPSAEQASLRGGN